MNDRTILGLFPFSALSATQRQLVTQGPAHDVYRARRAREAYDDWEKAARLAGGWSRENGWPADEIIKPHAEKVYADRKAEEASRGITPETKAVGDWLDGQRIAMGCSYWFPVDQVQDGVPERLCVRVGNFYQHYWKGPK